MKPSASRWRVLAFLGALGAFLVWGWPLVAGSAVLPAVLAGFAVGAVALALTAPGPDCGRPGCLQPTNRYHRHV